MITAPLIMSAIGRPKYPSRNIFCKGRYQEAMFLASSHFKGKFENKPESKKLREQAKVHLHGHEAGILQRLNDCHFKATRQII